MLPDQSDAILGIDGDDPGRDVLEVDDAVDPRLPVGPDDLVVPDRQPRVLIGDPARTSRPRAVATGSSSMPGIVARGGRRRPRPGPPVDSRP